MTKKRNTSNQPQQSSLLTSLRKRISWIIVLLVVIVIILIYRQNKSMSNESATPMAPMFKKQGELTLQKQDGQPIITIDIEIADDENKREIGMMGRPVMGEREGMLFIFEEEYMASFWMKNTILPLDIIFINKRGEIVTINKNTKPFSEESYTAMALTLFVLEVNAGFTDKYGIKEGDRIVWKRM